MMVPFSLGSRRELLCAAVDLWWSHVCLRVTRHSNGGSERAAHAQLLQQLLRQAPRLAAKEHDGKRKGLVHTAWGRRLGRGRLRRGRLRRGRLGRRGGGTQAVQHRHRRHLLVSLAACSLAFTAASASALSRAAATLRSLRGPPPRPPPARYESAAACCSAATDALLIRRVAHRTWPPSCVFLRGDL